MSFLQIPIGTYPNTFLGYESSISITTGISNTAFGNRTLNANTSGNWNSTFGNLALEFNQTGTENSAFGDRALRVSRGSGNSGFGSSVMLSLFTGLDNSAFGTNALYRIVSGNRNAAFGANALSFPFSAESENSAFGYGSLNGLNGGNRNSAFGYQSGVAITSGSKNTILGSYSGNQGGLDIRTLSNYIVISDGDGNPRIWVDNTGQVNFPGGSVLPGGTANGVLYLNGSKVVTSGSGLTFDGTTLGSPQVLLPNGNSYQIKSAAGVASAVLGMDASNNLYLGASGAVATNIFYTGGSEQMRLTNTGLGIGTSSPTSIAGFTSLTLNNAVDGGLLDFQNNTSLVGRIYNNATSFYVYNQTANPLIFGTSGLEKMRLDSSGNLGLGVTPSAWGSPFNALQVSRLGLRGSTATSGLSFNAYYDGSAFIYIASSLHATDYYQNSGQHVWSVAAPGTAGNAISFTQAMTLTDANRLLIGATADKTQEVLRIASSGQASLLLDNAGKTNGAFVGAFNDAALFGVNRNPSTGVFYNTSNYAAEIVALGSSSNSYIAFATANAANTPATERLRLKSTGQLRYVPLAADPANAEAGDVYYNSSTNKLRLYAAGAWVDLN